MSDVRYVTMVMIRTYMYMRIGDSYSRYQPLQWHTCTRIRILIVTDERKGLGPDSEESGATYGMMDNVRTKKVVRIVWIYFIGLLWKTKKSMRR
jgi:hypothetical protein